MESRIALIGIFIENQAVSTELNRVLHDFAPYIIGRMGIPYKEKNISIISLAIDADNDIISSLSGKLGMLRGIHVKTMYSRK